MAVGLRDNCVVLQWSRIYDEHNDHMPANLSPSPSAVAQALPDTGTVARVVLLLRLAAESRDSFSLKEIANSAGLPVPTVYRLLDLLAREGLIAPEGGRRGYRIGTELYRIGSLVKANAPIPRLINVILFRAVAEADETCHFVQYLPEELAIMFDSSVESSHPLDFRWDVHKPLSLIWGASGRTVLAFLDEAKVDQALEAEPKGPNDRQPPARGELLNALSEIRRLGYGFTRGQRIRSAISIFAPVFDENNTIYGALGFVIPEPRFDPAMLDRLTTTAKKFAGQLSSALGANR